MSPTIAGFRELIAAEGASLLAQLPSLTAEDWRRPSPCAGWDVLDVLVHMQLGTTIHVAMVENAVAGRMEAPWDIPAGADPSAWFKEAQRTAHAEGAAVNVERLRTQLGRYDAALASATDGQLAGSAWFYGLPATLGKVVAAYTFDLIVHASDIRRPVGIEPWFSPDGSRFAGPASMALLPMFVTPERLAGANGVVRQEIDGTVTLATLGADGLALHGVGEGDGSGPSASAPTPAATLVTDGGTWTLLSWRGFPMAEAERRSSLRIDGDRALVERYLAAIKTP